ncbi:WSC-domain-containing protein [Trichocladium antarcticum]|uniref:WSC-domain-containing protein n=1 Tax=Trichocladium antarcticum TaxID=1450529 RepID=A0AAN6UD39_9PEZI|nr:WSC-domain-containing protein [Trichocladium antarcticum]
MHPSPPFFPPFLILLLLLLLLSPPQNLATAQTTTTTTTTTAQLAIPAAPSSGYAYHGCYNETLGLPDTAGVRALHGGTNKVAEGAMTVDMCWAFCRTGAGDSSGGKAGAFEFAGLQYARECWCAQSLSSLSERFPDSECNLPCEGNTTQACGGYLKLTVYQAGAAAARVAWAAGLAAVGAISLTLS